MRNACSIWLAEILESLSGRDLFLPALFYVKDLLFWNPDGLTSTLHRHASTINLVKRLVEGIW